MFQLPKAQLSFLVLTLFCLLSSNQARATLEGSFIRGGLMVPEGDDPAATQRQILTALRFSFERFNKYLSDKNGGSHPWGLRVYVRYNGVDRYGSTPVNNLDNLCKLGINLVLGPLTSGHLNDLIELATTNDVLLFSYGSISSAEKFRQVDTIFRVLPDDSNQIPHLARKISAAGILYVVVIYRDDDWGSALNKAFSSAWLKDQEDSRTLGEAVPYAKNLTDFTNVTSTLGDQMQAAFNEYDSDQVAVLYIGFEEVADVMAAANATGKSLGDVRWFGIDTEDARSTIFDNGRVQAFANQVKYVISEVAPDTSDEDYVAFLEALSGVTDDPGSFAFAAFDTYQLLGRAIEKAEATDTASVSQALPEVAMNYSGLMGPARLNEYGDRATGNYRSRQVKGDKFVLIDGDKFFRIDNAANSGATSITTLSLTITALTGTLATFYFICVL